MRCGYVDNRLQKLLILIPEGWAGLLYNSSYCMNELNLPKGVMQTSAYFEASVIKIKQPHWYQFKYHKLLKQFGSRVFLRVPLISTGWYFHFKHTLCLRTHMSFHLGKILAFDVIMQYLSCIRQHCEQELIEKAPNDQTTETSSKFTLLIQSNHLRIKVFFFIFSF